jgi:hypothetical protein
MTRAPRLGSQAPETLISPTMSYGNNLSAKAISQNKGGQKSFQGKRGPEGEWMRCLPLFPLLVKLNSVPTGLLAALPHL